MTEANKLLVIGEVFVDYTLSNLGKEPKLRLGGVVHAARGLWAAGLDYAMAVVCPKYLVEQTEDYLKHHGCSHFVWIGEVLGSPNVMVIGDPREVSDQDYDYLLREEKTVRTLDIGSELDSYTDVLVFPGEFNISSFKQCLSSSTRLSFDIAYDIDDPADLKSYRGSIGALILSTSSELFLNKGSEDISSLITSLTSLDPEVILIKENRGGSRLFNAAGDCLEEIPAVLDITVNSVGVGDVYSSVMVGLNSRGWIEAAWRGARSATYYSQTTYPDDFKRDVCRDLKLSLDELRSLGGTHLPWHDRKNFQIYLAAPDFSHVHKPEVEAVIASLKYHNFSLRRPVLENGQLAPDSEHSDLCQMYEMDLNILRECDVLFAIPLEKDPGTLVEIGIAINEGKPVVTYDPRKENNNTMVIAGSSVYSQDLDECLNGLFTEMSRLRNSLQ